MALRSLTAATLAAAAAGELHCLGRVAHEIESSEQDLGTFSIHPAPDRDRECEARLGGVHAHRICLGVNQNKFCDHPVKKHIPLPMQAHCEECFVGMETDVFIEMELIGYAIGHFVVGFRQTRILAQLELSDDAALPGQPRTGSMTFGEKPIELPLKLGNLINLTLKVEMPTRIYYEALTSGNFHGTLGTYVDLDMGNTYVEYLYGPGRGWSFQKDKPDWYVSPIAHEGDYDGLANLTVGFESSLRLELGSFAWYNLDMSSEVPIGLTSVGAAGNDTMHSCVDLGMKFDVTHEADFNLDFLLGLGIKKHFGPVTDHYRDGSVVHECRDLHPDRPSVVVLV